MSDADLNEPDRYPDFRPASLALNLCSCYVVAEVVRLLAGIGKANCRLRATVIDVFGPLLMAGGRHSPTYLLKQSRESRARLQRQVTLAREAWLPRRVTTAVPHLMRAYRLSRDNHSLTNTLHRERRP